MTDLTPNPTSTDWAGFTVPDYAYPSTMDSSFFDPKACTFEICGFSYSYWSYRPKKSVNLAFTILFSISALAFLAQSIASKKRWLSFTIAMVLGCIIEVIGYAGRVKASDDLYSEASTYF